MLKRNIFLMIASITLVFAGSTAVQAASCGTTNDGAAIETSVINCNGQGEQALWDLLRQIITIMTGGIGALAVGAVVAGGILYAMSGNHPERIKQAKTIWNNTVIGLAIFAFFAAIINFIIPGGVFG